MKINLNNEISSLKRAQEEMSKTIQLYKRSEWEDDVHNSYERFVGRDISNCIESITSSARTMSSVVEELTQIQDAKDVKSQVNDYKSEANSINTF